MAAFIMLGVRLAEKENMRANALGTFLDNNVHHNFLAVGMGEQQRLEIERLRRELDNVTRERNSLKRRLEVSNDEIYVLTADTRDYLRHLGRCLPSTGISRQQLVAVNNHINEMDNLQVASLRTVRNSMSEDEFNEVEVRVAMGMRDD